ncbi:hypothetical protein ACFP3U_36265 [Kitasatospora misakiensis]|uniref:Uncharacterized protein n=1 Tax=Kitasatospora misakiensis TaxID=67330 RepID=A0ABW0XIT6_9ACTN
MIHNTQPSSPQPVGPSAPADRLATLGTQAVPAFSNEPAGATPVGIVLADGATVPAFWPAGITMPIATPPVVQPTGLWRFPGAAVAVFAITTAAVVTLILCGRTPTEAFGVVAGCGLAAGLIYRISN